MSAPSLFSPFLEPLERLGWPYCITGSVAASVYGEPRLTADIDIDGTIYPIGTTVDSQFDLAFYNALLKIWIGAHPADTLEGTQTDPYSGWRSHCP